VLSPVAALAEWNRIVEQRISFSEWLMMVELNAMVCSAPCASFSEDLKYEIVIASGKRHINTLGQFAQSAIVAFLPVLCRRLMVVQSSFNTAMRDSIVTSCISPLCFLSLLGGVEVSCHNLQVFAGKRP
jgi:hypothetical protein